MTDESLVDLKGVNFSAAALFYGSAPMLEDLARLASDSIEAIRNSDNPRLVVLESWLLLDYALREFLMAGLSLHRYSTTAFDLRYELLPRGFTACVELVEGLRKAYNPRPPDPGTGGVSSSAHFWLFLSREHPQFFARLGELEEEYFQEHHAGQSRESHLLARAMRPPTGHDEYCELPEAWVRVAEKLDSDWFAGARRLNNARNLAAHSHDRDAILRAFGLTGPNALDQLKKQCKQLILNLVGVEKLATP